MHVIVCSWIIYNTKEWGWSMSFQVCFNTYCEQIGCTNKELEIESGVNASVISRYRRGERQPDLENENIEKLANGLEHLSAKLQIPIEPVPVLHYLELELQVDKNESMERANNFAENLDAIMKALKINNIDLAHSLKVDPSFLSRIRNKSRRPYDLEVFEEQCVRYVERKCQNEQIGKELSSLIDFSWDTSLSPADQQDFHIALLTWFQTSHHREAREVQQFFTQLDQFDLNTYMKSIHFNTIKVPSVPIRLPTSQTYYGIKQMREGELSFLKSTALSKSEEDVFMYSNMPMEDMAKDMNFNKQWMFGIAVVLKKGLHLSVIHNLNRPFQEMMLGLLAWIPIYMTGQVSPYYLERDEKSLFCHLLYHSGSVALSGECIKGHPKDGMYYLTKKKDELKHYQTTSALLLKTAKPLMRIYQQNQQKQLNQYMSELRQRAITRKSFLHGLPIRYLSAELLDQILEENMVSEERKTNIKEQIANYQEMEQANDFNSIEEMITVISEDQFRDQKVTLYLAPCFLEDSLYYSYETYQKHLEEVLYQQKKNKKIMIQTRNTAVFDHIQIEIYEGECVIVQKNNAPVIHFVIEHPQLCHAMEQSLARLNYFSF